MNTLSNTRSLSAAQRESKSNSQDMQVAVIRRLFVPTDTKHNLIVGTREGSKAAWELGTSWRVLKGLGKSELDEHRDETVVLVKKQPGNVHGKELQGDRRQLASLAQDAAAAGHRGTVLKRRPTIKHVKT